MSLFKPQYNLAIVGAGRRGLSILAALVPPRKEDEYLRVIGVADLNPQAPGILYAFRQNLFVTVNFPELLHLPDLDIVINATGSPEVSDQLKEQRLESLIILSVERPCSWENFWDLISMEIPSREDAPLRLGIVGGGKAGLEILLLITGDRRHQRCVDILGVADPDLEAPGIILAQSLKVPTFQDCALLLAEKPDLVLELTGDPQVREQVIQQKDPHTQVIDHIKARLLWDLLRSDENWLRSKIDTEIKLAGQRNRFQRIFDHLPDPVLVLRPDYLVEEANLPALKRFRKKAEEVVGRPCYEVFHGFKEPCDRRGMTCPLPGVMENRQVVKITQCFENINGFHHYDEITMAPLCPAEGNRKRAIEVIRDITTRKQLEEALQDSEERVRKDKAFLETIVNGIQDHMMVIDLDYRIIEVNRALLDMVGRRREDVVGKYCYEVSHHLKEPCCDPDHPCPLKDALATGKAASATHVHFDKDRRERYYQVICHPLFDENGRIHQVVDLSRDVTREIAARTQMLHDDKMTSLGKLSASVVHEINNPLTGVLNFVKLMQAMLSEGKPSQADLEDIRKYLSMVYAETIRVSRTLTDLLAFSRKARPQFQPVNLNEVIDETISLIGNQMLLQQITIEPHLDGGLQPVLADRGQMKQVLVNLFLNAQEAMPQGGVLTVETRNARRNVRMRVADQGRGIPKESLPHIFEPFFTTKKNCAGAGLGLSVVYGIIRDHKGTIKVDSVPGQGTTFTIFLGAWKAGEEHAAA
jgi:two-component system, NtrC family, sensor kinase